MHSSSRTFAPPLRPRRIDTSRRTTTAAEPKPHGPVSQREDKNMNTISSSSPRRATKAIPESSRTRVGVQPRAPLGQSRLGLQRNTAPLSTTKSKPKPKSVRAAAAVSKRAPFPPPIPLLPHLDPNCNEPSLPCLCCDGHSPQDNNSLFNHNHNNNNTISIRQQLKLQPPPPPPLLPQRQEGTGGKTKTQASPSQPQPQVLAPACPPNALELEKGKIDEENADVNKNTDVVIDNKKETEEEMDNKKETEEEEENSVDVEVDDEEEGDDDDDDDTLVPSCCDCPPSLLDLSLTSSTSSSSTSISSCSDLESDCADLSTSLSSSGQKWNADLSISQDHTHIHVPERYPASRSPPVLLLNPKPLSVSRCPPPPPHACSPDEGYPSAPASPSSSDYLGVKGQTGLGSEVAKIGLLDFLESVGDFGKMERFSQVIQVARWDLEGDPQGDLLRDRLDHLDRLESVNRQVKLAHITRLHEKGLDLGDLGKEDLSDVLDEMGNVDMSWKMYKGRGGSLGDSQEFSDAGVDLTAPSDCDEPLVSQSETSSPIELPPRPPKPPARYASVNSELHTYINISRDITPSVSVCTSPSSSPTFYTFRCEKALPPSPRSVPPPLLCQPIPYFTLYKSSPLPFSLPSSTPPIPPPRRKHLARKEAQRLATLQAGCGKTPLSLSPPTSRPPPLPPAPTISISNSTTPPAIPPPPSLPPPPSFHALDDEIRKLLVLAGLTQAELLKLSPELGVCVGGTGGGGRGGDPPHLQAWTDTR
ncbi:uncharacterized protein LOC127927333 [Oncorhynchus keta]|uniref:uncharacterized protein LOC127927333 n=1 Tax=Oncorhynchus keta TaxID=8018 RepID=UPI00227D6E41|nr:uncharacterized protein LOC127927333 [Oncorhynchus keta]